MTVKARIAKLETKTPKPQPPALTEAEFINRLEKFLHADPDPKADPGGMYERSAKALRAALQVGQNTEKDGNQ